MDGEVNQIGRLFKEKWFLNIKYFIIFIQNYKMSPSPKRKKPERCFAIVSVKKDKYERCKNKAKYHIDDSSLGYCTSHYRQFTQKGVIISSDKKKKAKAVCFGKAKNNNKFTKTKCIKEYRDKNNFKKIISAKLPPDDADSGLFTMKSEESDSDDDPDEDESDSDSDSSSDDDSDASSTSSKSSDESESGEESGDESESDEESGDEEYEEDYGKKKKYSLEESFIQNFVSDDYNDVKPKNFANWLKKDDIQQFFVTLYYHKGRNQVLTDIEDIVAAFNARYVGPTKPPIPPYNKRITNRVLLEIKDIIKNNIPRKFYSEPKIDLLLVYLFDYPSRDLNKNFDQYGVTGFGQGSDLSPAKTIGKDKDYSIFPFPYGKGSKVETTGQQRQVKNDGTGGPLDARERKTPESDAATSTESKPPFNTLKDTVENVFGKSPKPNASNNLDDFYKKIDKNQYENFITNLQDFKINDPPADGSAPAYGDNTVFEKYYFNNIFSKITDNDKKPYGFGFWNKFIRKYDFSSGDKSIYKELNSYIKYFGENEKITDRNQIFDKFTPNFMKSSSGGRIPAGSVAASPRKGKK